MNINPFGKAVVDLSQALQPSAVKAFFTTRHGGVSKGPYSTFNLSVRTGDDPERVAENLKRLEKACDLPKRWLTLQQVHGNHIVVDNGLINGMCGEGDGLVSRYKDVVITTYHADCYPVFAFCEASGVMGLAHAGWQGVYHEIPRALFGAMVSEGASLDTIKVVIGPGIGRDAYQVSVDLATQFRQKFGSDVILGDGDFNQPRIDLVACLYKTILASGLVLDQVTHTGQCTYQLENDFYSHRRDGAKTGRMMALLMRRD